jgi:hypothetical protein
MASSLVDPTIVVSDFPFQQMFSCIQLPVYAIDLPDYQDFFCNILHDYKVKCMPTNQ